MRKPAYPKGIPSNSIVPLIRSFTSGTGSLMESGQPMFMAIVTLPLIMPWTYRFVIVPVAAMVKESSQVYLPASSVSSTRFFMASIDVSNGSWNTGVVRSSSGPAGDGQGSPPKANPPLSTPRTKPVGPRTSPPTVRVAINGPRSQT